MPFAFISSSQIALSGAISIDTVLTRFTFFTCTYFALNMFLSAVVYTIKFLFILLSIDLHVKPSASSIQQKHNIQTYIITTFQEKGFLNSSEYPIGYCLFIWRHEENRLSLCTRWHDGNRLFLCTRKCDCFRLDWCTDFIGNRNNTNWLWLIFYNNCTVKYTLLMTFTHTKNCSKYIHIRNRSAI